jgi:hypothetical protein
MWNVQHAKMARSSRAKCYLFRAVEVGATGGAKLARDDVVIVEEVE